mmetsp:Transcript_11389/g.15518  ORF Transcript_11389/g.15518 Transcript_11389/m.15518 type:complete len:240 (+) Transcript_11389:62-781(+)|eukprot:CAMPEP_0196570246 /NCGR_PEP_ID=MMETSP1081-20130531/98_1 /TAXON_ID=36882 /ORGANISM="Pyramimonas amylifera, Strain CCMP720" /LENGTH=239 /DNA_ID=CAMNT_0041886553 /DNA_START=116 /DNA_END=835 /DNA_ORIENTATION=+
MANKAAQKKVLEEVFKLCDKDGGGEISRNELFKVGQAFNRGFTKEKCAALFKKIDANGDGQVSKAEFVTFMEGITTGMKEATFNQCISDFRTNLKIVHTLPDPQNYSADVAWMAVKNNNAFLVKRQGGFKRGGVQFSSETNNVRALNTFKYSGLANSETVEIKAGGAVDELVVSVSKGESSNTYKGPFVNMATSVIKYLNDDLDGQRPDLKKASMSKLSYTHKALRMAKAGVKKSKAKK